MKSLQIVASLTAERDGETRKAALNSLATGYKILGTCWYHEINGQIIVTVGLLIFKLVSGSPMA